MIGAEKVISSQGIVGKVGGMFSRAGVSSCGVFLFIGEYDNPESETRNAIVTVIEGESGEVVGNPIMYLIH